MCSDLKSGQKRRREDEPNTLTHNCLYNIDLESILTTVSYNEIYKKKVRMHFEVLVLHFTEAKRIVHNKCR